jgi:hypothetical protein
MPDDYDRDDLDDARPSRRRRDRDDYDRPDRDQNETNVAGVFGLVIGVLAAVVALIALCVSVIPCFGSVSIIIGSVSLLLALVAGLLIKLSGSQGLWLPVSGTIVSGLAIAIGIFWLALGHKFMEDTKQQRDRMEKNLREQEQQLQQQQQQRDAVRTAPVINVTALELFEAYEKNTLNADGKYKRQLLEITGTIVQVRDGAFNIVVELEGKEDSPESVIHCEFRADHRDALRALEAKQTVKIRGRCRGKFFRNITLEDCVLAQ